MARLYADENVVHRVVVWLRACGHDVVTALDDGRANRQVPDSEVLNRAIELKRCAISNNRKHFHRLHVDVPAHFGILTYTTDPHFDALADRIHTAIEAAGPLEGRLIRVVRPNP